MKSVQFYVGSLTSATLLLGLSLILGCSRTNQPQEHPDEVDSVSRALIVNGLYNVTVSQDRTWGVMTLTGNVLSQDKKAFAEQIAQVNASDYTIANEIGVTPPPPPSQLIADKYKAVLQAHKNLDFEDVNYEMKDGALVLSGNVHSAHERTEAVKLAKSVPNVERVVDEIKITS